MDSNNVSEAMGLAGMNPVVGIPADHSHRGSLIVNVTNHDKDLEDDGKRMTTVARNLDMDDNLYGIDRFGKVFAKKKYEVMERPDVWEDDIVEVFKVNKDCEPIIEQLEKEASLPYDERPIHKPTYIYEVITGHTMYTEDQMYYDKLLEKVELEKMSAVLSGTSGGLGRQKNLEQKGNKDAGYIPDNDFPSGTENMNSGIVLASAELQEGFLDTIKGKFREMHHKGIRDALTYYKYPIYVIVPHGMDPEGMFCSSFELAFNDYVFYFNKDFIKKNKLDITSKYKVPKEWWGKNKDELVDVYVLSYPKKITEPSVFTADHLNMLDGIKFGPYYLEDLAKAMGIDSIQEAMVRLWEQNGRDLKLLREISNMKIELEGDTLYSVNEEFGYKSNPIVFSDDDVYINFDKFTSGKEHVLFITGLSGAGKSTLGEKLGKKYNAYYVETDVYAFAIAGFSEKRFKCMNFKYIDENDKMLGKYFREKNIPPDIMKDINYSNYDSSKKNIWESRVNDYIKWLIDEQKERVIIAGGHVAVFLQNYPKYCDTPTIFKGTSLFKSIYRRIFVRKDRSLLDQLKRFPRTMKQYRKMWSEVNNARLNVMGSNDWDYIREHVSLSDGLFSLLGLQESSNNPRFLTQTKIPYDCEVKNCYWNMQGPIKEGQPNLILHHKNKNWRVRAELLLFKEDKVFLHKENKMTQYGTYYRIPGGGIDDPKEYIEKAACRECEEECLVIPKNVRYTGKTIFKVYEKQPYWHSKTLNKNGIYYDGAVSFICTGEYDKRYTKYVRKMDQDSMKNGAFYSYDEVKDLLSKEHKKIFEDYLNKK